MDLSYIVPIAVFFGITLGVWAVIGMFGEKDNRATERLDELKDPSRRAQNSASKNTGMGGALKKAAPALSRVLQPKTELEENNLKVRLANAGYNSPNAPTFFLAIKLACLIAGVMFGGGFGAFKYGLNYHGMCSLVIGGGLGFYMPEIVIRILRKQRMDRVFLSLPDALDLLVVCVEAGLGLDAAMRRVADELADAAPDVCSELNLANLQLQMGRQRREVLHDLGIRTGVDDMKALVAILIQADRFGSSVAQALRVQSDSMRTRRRQKAEEEAAKTAVKLIFPLVLFIFPAIFVVLVGPAAIQIQKNLLNKMG
jgi:tight adherence protein C